MGAARDNKVLFPNEKDKQNFSETQRKPLHFQFVAESRLEL